MGLFSGDLNKVATSGGIGFPLLPGSYQLRVTETKGFKTRKNQPAFEVLFLVEESNNPDQKVGSIVNEFSILSEDYSLAKVKTILCVLNGLDPSNTRDADIIASENWNDQLEMAVVKPELFAGRLVNCLAVEAIAKVSKNKYVRRTYSPNAATRAKLMAVVEKSSKASK